MAWEYPLLDQPGALAGSDFSTGNGYNSTGQFLICKIIPAETDNTYVPCTSVKDRPSGISQNNPKSGDALQLRKAGISKVVAGATLVAGQAFGTDANGKAVPKNETSTGANYGDFVLGEVIEGAAAGALATVYFASPYRI